LANQIDGSRRHKPRSIKDSAVSIRSVQDVCRRFSITNRDAFCVADFQISVADSSSSRKITTDILLMFPQKSPTEIDLDSETYPLGEKCESLDDGHALALLALSHTSTEHRLYSAMLSAPQSNPDLTVFTARNLMSLTGIRSVTTIRRALEGLVVKLSVAKRARANGGTKREQANEYRVFQPGEVIARRNRNGGNGHSLTPFKGNQVFDKAIARISENALLSRREAQVALCCVEGLTNADIGKRLSVSEQTVKFHLRHVFVKFGVKRRAELISRLLT
jgi:DNA-binding CsgD family transcriptional regulator